MNATPGRTPRWPLLLAGMAGVAAGAAAALAVGTRGLRMPKPAEGG